MYYVDRHMLRIINTNNYMTILVHAGLAHAGLVYIKITRWTGTRWTGTH